MMTIAEQNHLIEDNVDFARNVARSKHRPGSITLEEVESAAFEGLVEAARRYDPQRNPEFRGYAYFRIAGAIGDYLRQETAWHAESEPLEEVPAQNPQSGELFPKLARQLPQQSRVAFLAYYAEGKKIKEIASELAVHESRISQLLASSRRLLAGLWRAEQLWAEIRTL